MSSPVVVQTAQEDVETGSAPAPIALLVEAAAPSTPSTEEERALARLEQLLSVEVSRIGGHLKLYIPFFLLLLVKFLVSNASRGIQILLVFGFICKIRSNLQLQLALKSNMNVRVLFVTAFLTAITALMLAGWLEPLGYSQDLVHRLLFFYSVNRTGDSSVWAVLWSCWITDLFVQLLVLLIKTLICLGQATYNLRGLKRHCAAWRARSEAAFGGILLTERPQSSPGVACHDIEANTASTPLSRSSLLAPTSATLTSRRSSSHGDGTDRGDDATSDISEDANEVDQEFVFVRKLCTLVDIVGYLYRSTLPIPLWVDNLSTGSFGNGVFPVVYIALKLTDLSWKLRGTAEAFAYFVGHKLEFGHYSTLEEYDERRSTYSCPICFESPRKAVTLDCHHIFCEACISEWVDKEKTCPVCRSEVRSCATLFGTIKKEATSFNQVII